MQYGLIALLVIAALIVFGILIFMMRFLGLWIQALVSNAKVDLLELVGMWFRKVDPRMIVLSRIQAKKAGIDIPTKELEAHYLARGDVPRVVNAVILADRSGIPLDWETACVDDLAGLDPLGMVQTLIKEQR
jgi:uncharacterized protein YqfA (UPF0365 family)